MVHCTCRQPLKDTHQKHTVAFGLSPFYYLIHCMTCCRGVYGRYRRRPGRQTSCAYTPMLLKQDEVRDLRRYVAIKEMWLTWGIGFLRRRRGAAVDSDKSVLSLLLGSDGFHILIMGPTAHPYLGPLDPHR
ncbi:hypothetical protein BDW74DRAFT_28223 [Aspergillus multicolor]|uniref:uncharacterized protein n=1 Tax=Aspergillus multicolor TaxID=41759 RepID=UPI003CCE48DB